MKALTWEDILADRSLRDLPYKIETNRHNKIIMSPASSWHANYGHEIGVMLRERLGHGKVLNQAPVRTTEGVWVANVAWMSRERWQPHRRTAALPITPEICVENLSPSNTREEMLEKMTLYYAKGAQEVWLCDEEGRMEFFTALSGPQPVPVSVLCPDSPPQIDVD